MKLEKEMKIFLAGLVSVILSFPSPVLSASSSVEAVLKSFLDGKRPMEDLSVVYEAGRQYFGGHISLSISGDRTVKLQFSLGEQKKDYQGLLSKDGLSSLLKTLLEDKVWTASPSAGKKVPDAAEIEISLSTRQKDLNYHLVCRETEALKIKELQTLVFIFRGIIKVVSNGEVKNY